MRFIMGDRRDNGVATAAILSQPRSAVLLPGLHRLVAASSPSRAIPQACPIRLPCSVAASCMSRAIHRPGWRTPVLFRPAPRAAGSDAMRSACACFCGSCCRSRPLAGRVERGRRDRPNFVLTLIGARCPARRITGRGWASSRAPGRTPSHRTPAADQDSWLHDPLRFSITATSTLARSVRAMASHSLSHRTSVFHEYRCFAL